MFIIFLIVILVILYFLYNYYNIDNFKSNCYSPDYIPYNPPFQTPQINYQKIISKINDQDQYKKDLYVALAPTPTIHCPELKNKDDCNKYGCNWFDTFCSSTYPTQY